MILQGLSCKSKDVSVIKKHKLFGQYWTTNCTLPFFGSISWNLWIIIRYYRVHYKRMQSGWASRNIYSFIWIKWRILFRVKTGKIFSKEFQWVCQGRVVGLFLNCRTISLSKFRPIRERYLGKLA